jgi:hypothetical protein
MATISEIRQQYPQYSDMSDVELADAFHSKFYSDIPKDQFYSTLGVTTSGQPVAPQAPVAQQAPGTMELMFGAGSPIARTVKGAVVDPALAVNQILAQVFPESVKKAATQNVVNVEQAVQQGRARIGSTGFDPYQLLGNVISPTNKLVGFTQAPLTAGGLLSAGGTGVALSALQPVVAPSEEFAGKKLEQMGTGFVLGPVIQGGVSAISSLAGLFKNLTPTGRQEYMQKQLNELAGPERTRVIESLKDAKELVSGSRPTAAQALSDIPSSVELIAAERKLATQPKVVAKFADRAAEQQAARVRALQNVSGTEADRLAMATERTDVTSPMREMALQQANVAGPIYTRLEKEIADKFNSIAAAEQTAGMTGLVSTKSTGDIASQAKTQAGLYKELAGNLRKDVQLKQFQINSLEQNGFFPLRASDIIDQLDSAIKGTVSDQSKAVLQGTKDKILSKVDENGLLNSRDVYENIRKPSNQDIAKWLGLSDQYASAGIPAQAAKALGNTKKFIDASLNKSSEGLWSKYLTSYTDYSNKLNRMEIGDYLVNKLQSPMGKEDAGAFASAVENATATIKKSTGIPRFDKLSDVLSPPEIGAVNNVLADLKRSSKADELAKKVGAVEIGGANVAKEIPPLLSRTISIARSAIEHLQRGNTSAYNEQMAQLMMNPGALAQFMSVGIPKGRLNDLVSSMMKLMDEPTKKAFIQSFTVPAMANEQGVPRVELNNMASNRP